MTNEKQTKDRVGRTNGKRSAFQKLQGQQRAG